MAVSRNVIEFLLRADTSGLTGPLTKAKGDLEGLGTAAVKAGKETGAGLDALQSKLSSTANKMMGVGAAMTAATLPLAAALKSGLNALIEGERKAAQTAAVIKSTGGAANVSADDIKKMSGSLRDMSGVSAGTIREGQNMLLTFTKVRNSVGAGNDIFNQASKAILNMSVAMGTDMKTAAIQVGKALNDPIKGLTALNRVGIQFSAQQKEQIEGFVKMGDVASAQKVILKELETQFGGSAEAFGDTAAGQAAKLENELTKLKMTLAEQLLPAFKVVVEQVSKLVNWFNSLDEGTKAWVATAAVALVAGGPILTGIGALTKGLSALIGLYGRLTVAAGEAAAAQEVAATRAGGIAGRIGGTALGAAAAGGLAGAAGGLLGGGGDIGKGATGALAGGAAGALGFAGMGGPLGVLTAAGSTTNPTFVRDTDEAENGFRRLDDLVRQVRESVNAAGDDMDAKFAAIRNSVGTNMQGSAEDINRLQGELQRIGHEAGFASIAFDGTSGSITGMSAQFYTAEQRTQGLIGFFQNLGPMLQQSGIFAAAQALSTQQIATAAGQASINVGMLNQNLENSFNPYVQAEQSAVQYTTALQGVDTALQQKATSQQQAQQLEQQAQQTMVGLLATTGQRITSLGEEGASIGAYNEVQTETAARLDKLAEKYPALRGKADEYKQKITELIDQSKQPITNKVNVETEEATRKLNEYKRLVATVQGNILTSKVPVPATPPAGARGGVIKGGVAYFAGGGLFNQATAIVGEGNAPEYVIPTDRKYRGRALGLWQQAGAALMAEGGTVGGDGASLAGPLPGGDGGATLGVLGQIRDLLAQIAGAAAAAPAAVAAPTAAPAGGPAGPGGGADAAGGTDALTAATTAYGAAAAAATVVSQGLDAALVVSATATLPTLTAATQLGDQTTHAATASTAAQIPVQAQWQTTLAASKVGVDMLTAAVAQLIGQMQGLNATQVVLHIDHSQVATAAGSIGGLASAVQGALSSMGLTTNALSQWLGVVLALPSGVLAGAVGAESGGVVGNVGAGWKGHSPTLVMEGSRSYDEYVIPTDPKHRANAMGLLGGLHQDLGIQGLAGGGVVGKVDQAIAATTANAVGTSWGGTATSAPGSLGKVSAGSMIAAAAASTATAGSGSPAFVQFAMQQDGERYVWGAEGPDAWDCSGLVLGAAAAAGLPGLPHYSGSQIDMAQQIPVDQAIGTPGALLWKPGHIAISQGNGKTIEARGIAYGVGQWEANRGFAKGGLLPFPNSGGGGKGSDGMPAGWRDVGQFIADKFRVAGIGVGPSVGGEAGEVGNTGTWTGRISWFGGPNDPGAMGGMAFNGTTMDAYNAGVPYAAMRLSSRQFQGRYGEIDLPPRAWVNINHNGLSAKAQILDWGPGWRTNRLIDVAPYVMDALGASTDDTVGVSALAAGGKIASYDQGGYLPEGLSLAYNGTGRPEPVGHHLEQPTVVVNVTVEGSVMAENDLATSIGDKIRANIRRGYIWKIN